MQAALQFSDLTLGYERHPAVHHLNGSIEQGALLAVVGPNGAGKSTLFKAIAGRIAPLSGRIERFGQAASDIGYLPQSADIDRDFPIRLYDMVAMGLWRQRGMFSGVSRAQHALIADAIAKVGLNGFEQRQIGTLSGGQMQRMLFARLLLEDARVIVLDEPFAAVDERTVGDLIALMQSWHAQGRTVIAALHDLDLVRRHFPRSLLLAREQIAWESTATALGADNLARARRMCEAFDDHAHDCAA